MNIQQRYNFNLLLSWLISYNCACFIVCIQQDKDKNQSRNMKNDLCSNTHAQHTHTHQQLPADSCTHV